MSVIIQSGATADQWTVDAASKAGRVSLYRPDGSLAVPNAPASYIAAFEVRHTAADAAGSAVFDIRGPPTLKARIRRIRGVVGFDGTALAASGTLRYGLYRGTGAADASTGTALAPVKKRTSMGAASIASGSFKSGILTVAGITYDTLPFHVLACPVISVQVAAPATSGSAGAWTDFDLQFGNGVEAWGDGLELAANEHLGIRVQTVAAIIGLSLCGSIEWDEA
jgi:hypothetical protein